jgi:phage terminase small subunit
MSELPELTESQERFVQEYLVDGNAGLAALRAGFDNASMGKMLMQLPEITEAIKALEEELDRRASVKAAWVSLQLKAIVERCMQAEPVIERGRHRVEIAPWGEVRAVFQFDPRAATKALELLGKQIGMFAENVNMKHSGAVDQKTEINTNDLARRVAFILQKAMRRKLTEKTGEQPSLPH